MHPWDEVSRPPTIWAYDEVATSAEHPTHLQGAATATPSEGAEPPSSINEDTDADGDDDPAME